MKSDVWLNVWAITVKMFAPGGDDDGGGGDGDGGDDDKFFLQEVDATLTPGRDNWGMGSMGGHPMMNNGGEPVSGYCRSWRP